MRAVESKPFVFKQFEIYQDKCAMKVGTDGVLLGAWVDVSDVANALDIGTGTGVIAIMLGQRTEKAQIHAVEIDEVSFEQARRNMERPSWSERLKVFHTSIQNFHPAEPEHYDLIVSNPPFFTGGTFSSNQQRNQVRHTVKMPHGDLLTAVRNLLAPSGRFCVVLPHIEGLRFQELAETYRLFCNRVTEVRPLPNKPVERLLLQFERRKAPVRRDELVLKKEGGKGWTKDYKDLTREFYLEV